MNNWFEEGLHVRHAPQGFAIRLEIQRLLVQERSAYQDIMIFESPRFGRVLTLDDAVQTTEADEFIYHEIMSHVPLVANGAPRRVLIIGGGDGGMLREVLRHPVERVTMVEIDRTVVERCREHLPMLSAGAFDDPRADVLFADGIHFVATTEGAFDVIIVDSTDPIGPGEVLFTETFYRNCRRRLAPGGIIVNQSGTPFLTPEETSETHARLTAAGFADVGLLVMASPTYVGGLMTLGWASDDPSKRRLPLATLKERWSRLGLTTRYYSPEMHLAAFVLPPYIADLCAAG